MLLYQCFKGVGGSGLLITIFTIISQIARREIRPILIGSFAGVFGIAAIFGPLLGGKHHLELIVSLTETPSVGVFTDRLTWRWCFYVSEVLRRWPIRLIGIQQINLPFGAIVRRTPSYLTPV